MITKLELENFRCFENFSLEGIRQITLIAGTNSVGKSTILESIFLFMDGHLGDVFLKLNAFRGIQQFTLSPKLIWEPLFLDMNVDSSITISAIIDGEEQAIILSKDESFSLSSFLKDTSLPNIDMVDSQLANTYPLRANYKSKEKNGISHFVLTKSGIARTTKEEIETKRQYTHYLNPKVNVGINQLSEWLGNLELSGKKSKCVDVLKMLDPRINDVSVIVIGGISSIFADIGLSSKLSVHMLGDGVNKLLYIALVMLANPGALILVDEIENGFHYSFFPHLWNIIGKLAIETGCQVIATSHSYECIGGAAVLTANSENSELFRYIRFERNNSMIIPKIFENDSFEYAIKNDWEVR